MQPEPLHEPASSDSTAGPHFRVIQGGSTVRGRKFSVWPALALAAIYGGFAISEMPKGLLLLAAPIAVLVLGNLTISRGWGGRAGTLLVRFLAWICGLGLTGVALMAAREVLPELLHDHRRDYGMGRLMDFLAVPLVLLIFVFASRFLTLALRPSAEHYRSSLDG